MRKTELHERLWPGTFVSDATLVGLVKELRRALDDRDTSTPICPDGARCRLCVRVSDSATMSDRSAVSRWIVAGDRRIALQNGENLVGRDPAAAICLDVAGVSRRHARIVVDEDGALLEDLGSRNGTIVEEELLTSPVRLNDGDRVYVGSTVIVFRTSVMGITTEIVPLRSPESRTKS